MCGLPEHGGFKGAKRHGVHIQKINIRDPIRHLKRLKRYPEPHDHGGVYNRSPCAH